MAPVQGFSYPVRDHADESIRELDDCFLNRTPIHAEGLIVETGSIGAMDYVIFIYRFINHIDLLHSILSVLLMVVSEKEYEISMKQSIRFVSSVMLVEL